MTRVKISFSIALCILTNLTYAQSWQEQVSTPLLQKEELQVPAVLPENIYIVYDSKLACPQKEIRYRFSKFEFDSVPPSLEDEKALRAKATQAFDLVLENRKIATSNMVKNQAGKEHTRSSITQVNMLTQAKAILKEINPQAFALGCPSAAVSLQDIVFDLSTLQAKPALCEKLECLLNSSEFWTVSKENELIRSFSTKQEAVEWFEFSATTLAKLPSTKYEKRLTFTSQKSQIGKSLKSGMLSLSLEMSSDKNEVHLTYIPSGK